MGLFRGKDDTRVRALDRAMDHAMDHAVDRGDQDKADPMMVRANETIKTGDVSRAARRRWW